MATGHSDGDPADGPMDLALRSAARMYADDQATKALGISIDGIGPGRARARMRVTGDMTNGHGIAHGGYIFLLADTAFAYACNSYGPVTVAQAGQITFLSPARCGNRTDIGPRNWAASGSWLAAVPDNAARCVAS